jgi:recombination protein RecA
MPLNPELQKLIGSINKKMGGEAVILGSAITAETMPKITSGSTTLDYILGGGFPGNQWNEIIGESSHGKTALALKCIAANQRRDPEFLTVWVAAEGWVPQYAEMLGVDTDRVIIVETTIMEEAYQAVIQFAESKLVDAIVVDSLPALVPAPEAEKNMDEMTVGRGALLTNKFFRVVGSAMKRSLTEDERPVLGLIINQYRMKIGVTHGDPRTTPGGQGKDYAFFTRTEVRRAEWITEGSGANQKKVGQKIAFRTIKNKVFPPGQVAFVDYYFKEASGGIFAAGDFDFAKEIVTLAIEEEHISRKGAWYYYGDRKWNGSEAVLQTVREEVDLMEELRDLVLSTPTDAEIMAGATA